MDNMDSPDYDVISYVDSAMEAIVEMKKSKCDANNGPCDLQPMAHIVVDDNGQERNLVLPLPANKHPIDGAREMIPGILFAAKQKGYKTKIIMLILESYMSNSLAPPDSETYQQGDYRKDFEENPSSTIKEALMVTGVNLEEDVQAINVTSFGYDDSGSPYFEKVISEIITPEQRKNSKTSYLFDETVKFARKIEKLREEEMEEVKKILKGNIVNFHEEQ